MEWSFEVCLTVFLSAAFISHLISFISKGRLSLPLVFGLIFLAGFSSGIFPVDFVRKTGLLEVGRIAFNVLIIHAGTMFSIRELRRNRKALLITLAGTAATAIVFITGLSGLVGRVPAILAAPSVVGGGATCAIASISVLDRFPEISFFPWLIFMFQCLFGVPVFAVMLKKEKLRLQPAVEPALPPGPGLSGRMNGGLKVTAFYLAALMLLSLLNRVFFNAFLSGSGLSLNLTALFIGIIAGETGLIDRGPLQNADCFGFLMLGLMSLMAESLAHVPIAAVTAMVPMALLCFAVSTLIMVFSAVLLSRPLGMPKSRAVLIGVSPLVPIPLNIMMIRGIIKPASPVEAGAAEVLIGETRMGSLYVVNIFSVMLISIAVCFI